MYTIKFYNTKMNLICTKKGDFSQIEKLVKECRSCGCVYEFRETTSEYLVQGTKSNCDELMFWAHLK